MDASRVQIRPALPDELDDLICWTAFHPQVQLVRPSHEQRLAVMPSSLAGLTTTWQTRSPTRDGLSSSKRAPTSTQPSIPSPVLSFSTLRATCTACWKGASRGELQRVSQKSEDTLHSPSWSNERHRQYAVAVISADIRVDNDIQS